MPKTRPIVMTIAGFDPSGGAGLLADIKTLEANKVYGLGVCSALTFQNAETFEAVNWVPLDQMVRQANLLMKTHSIDWIKVGLMENWTITVDLLREIKRKAPRAKVVLDPVMSASAGFDFHSEKDNGTFKSLIEELDFITPNWNEIQQLIPDKPAKEGAKILSKDVNVYLKGGHNPDAVGRDFLFTQEGKEYPFRAKKVSKYVKHGSGCVFASALTAFLARGFSPPKAGLKAKTYATRFLNSHPSLLGYHFR